jgi:hypothetical protein
MVSESRWKEATACPIASDQAFAPRVGLVHVPKLEKASGDDPERLSCCVE